MHYFFFSYKYIDFVQTYSTFFFFYYKKSFFGLILAQQTS